jgi:predicted secreted protein
MHDRRKMLATSAKLAALMASVGLLPTAAQAQWSKEAFDAKTLAEAVKGLGGGAPTVSKDVTTLARISPKTALSCPWAPPPRCPASSAWR